MTRGTIEAYLARLNLELARRGLVDPRILEEARGHLVDATEQAERRGAPRDVAQREAVARFGAAQTVAATFAAERYRMKNRLLFGAAVAIGLLIAYVDSRPHWDDAGITAFAMLGSAGILGLIAPRRAWLWALAVGIWIPAYAVARAASLGSLAMLVVLVFPFAGAYGAAALRRLIPGA